MTSGQRLVHAQGPPWRVRAALIPAAEVGGGNCTRRPTVGWAVRALRCFFCGARPDSIRKTCPCGAEYLGDGWWWVPDRKEARS